MSVFGFTIRAWRTSPSIPSTWYRGPKKLVWSLTAASTNSRSGTPLASTSSSNRKAWGVEPREAIPASMKVKRVSGNLFARSSLTMSFQPVISVIDPPKKATVASFRTVISYNELSRPPRRWMCECCAAMVNGSRMAKVKIMDRISQKYEEKWLI